MTIIKLRYWLLVSLMLFTCGCASTEQPVLTSRNCIISLAQQVGQFAFAANLVCEKEEPVKEDK